MINQFAYVCNTFGEGLYHNHYEKKTTQKREISFTRLLITLIYQLQDRFKTYGEKSVNVETHVSVYGCDFYHSCLE